MVRRKINKEHENHERWLVSYADFITLLFAFFVVLYATSEADSEKTKKFQKSVQQYLMKVGVVGGPSQEGSPGKNSGGLKEKFDANTFNPLNKSKKRSKKKEGMMKLSEYFLEENFSGDTFDRVINELSEEGYGVKISIASLALFPKGSTKLKPDAPLILDKISELIKKSGYRVIVEGHLSQNESSGKYSDWEMSSLRASTIVGYLYKVNKLDPTRLSVMSSGRFKPIFGDGEQKRKNSRIDFLIVTEDLVY